jgi:hypothetical protein
LEEFDGVQVLRLKAPRTKDIGYVRRTVGELVMPFAMLQQLRKSPLSGERWDGVVWYAPSIFHGPLASALKKSSGCKGYLIIRDIFPEWAVDMGLMGRGLPYRFFDAVARYPTHDGTGVRDYIHVVDLAEGHLQALNALETRTGAHVWNLGTGQGYSVIDMVRAFEAASGKPVPYRIAPRRPGDIATCYADPTKAARELSWKAKRGLPEMMRDAWRWQQMNPNGYR